jgi:hypothetical protein
MTYRHPGHDPGPAFLRPHSEREGGSRLKAGMTVIMRVR